MLAALLTQKRISIIRTYNSKLTSAADYLGGERRAIFEIGSNIATVEYSTVNDGIREGIESFISELTVPPEMQAMGIVAGTPDRATVNIIDKESIHVSLLVQAEENSFKYKQRTLLGTIVTYTFI